MCGGPEHIKRSPSSSPSPPSSFSENSSPKTMDTNGNNNNNHLTVDGDDCFDSLLELAANNDLDGFRRSLDRNPSLINDLDGFRRSLDRDRSLIDGIGMWYGRKKGCTQMVLQHMTPLMVAATYGSLDVLELILSVSGADVNRSCGEDKTTALHCAAAGGSVNAVDVVRVLLVAGADSNVEDANGLRPADVIIASPRLADVKEALEELLGKTGVTDGDGTDHHPHRVLMGKMNMNSSSLEGDGWPVSPNLNSTSSPMILTSSAVPEKREYPIDPSLPDIKNSIFATDEFRMFSFKVRLCSRAYSHDWTECPFVHPGENARRRDPRKYHYSCVQCLDFRNGACRRGDLCDYAHGVFECWLHPSQYRTKLCKDGMSCNRRVCFFAHTSEELRPLYVSTGSTIPSPRSSASAAMQMAAAMGLVLGSPSSVSAVMSPFMPPMSQSANGLSHASLNWPQPNVPTLHLPGSNLHSSRLRSSLSARDMPVDNYKMMQDFEAQQLINGMCLSRLGYASAGNRGSMTKTLIPSDLDDLFSADISSTDRYNSEQGAMFSPSHQTILNQLQQQQQSLLSPINTSMFSPRVVETQQLTGHNSLLQASIGISSHGRMSPRSLEPISPMSSRLAAIVQREKQHQTLRSLSFRDLGSNASAIAGSPMSSSLSKWGSPSGTLDWGVNEEELGRLRRSSSFELRSGGEEPDLSWVHSFVKESPPEKLVNAVAEGMVAATSSFVPTASSSSVVDGSSSNPSSKPQADGHDQAAALGALVKQMQLDQMVV